MRSRTWSLTLAAIAILSFVIALAWFLIAPGFEPLLALLTGVATLLGSFVVRETPKGGEGDAIPKPHFRKRAH